MKATCVRCQREWIISIKHRITKEGYVCPHCTSREEEKRANEK